MDLPVSTDESAGAGSRGVLQNESGGGIDGIDDPGALVIDGEARCWHGVDLGGGRRGQKLGDGGVGLVACCGHLWAADHGEFHPFVGSRLHDLLGVHDYGGRRIDSFVETVGAPPTGPVNSGIIKFGITTIDRGWSCSSSPSSKLNGWAGISDHCNTSSF